MFEESLYIITYIIMTLWYVIIFNFLGFSKLYFIRSMTFDFTTCKFRFVYEFIWDVNIYFSKKKIIAFGLNTHDISELFPLTQRWPNYAKEVFFVTIILSLVIKTQTCKFTGFILMSSIFTQKILFYILHSKSE